MLCSIDLRFAVPPILSLSLLVYDSSEDTCLLLPDGIASHEFLFLLALIFLIIVTLFFLLTSLKVPLNVSLDMFPICLKFGDFSGPLALSLLASYLLPPQQFCVAYFICICISPWFAPLVNIVGQFWQWFYQLLQNFPSFAMVGVNPSHEMIEEEPSTSILLDEADSSHDHEVESA